MNCKSFGRRIFTLVELIIVVVIIGILAAALIPKLTGAQAKSRDTARKADLNQLSTAMQTYFNDKASYTGNGCVDDIRLLLIPDYMKSIPSDPQRTRTVQFMSNNTCNKPGSYGILPIYKEGAMSGGIILVARPESDGMSANFILTQAGNTNIKKNDGSQGMNTTNCDGTVGNTECFNSSIEIRTLESNLCKEGTNYNPTVANAGCDTSTEGKANTQESMVYIITQ